MEPFGFIHYHLFCPFRIKYVIFLTKFKIWGLENVYISFYVVNQYHMKSAISVFLLQKSA